MFSINLNSQTFNGATGPITDNNCDATHDFPVTVSGIGTAGFPMVVNEIKFDITHTYDSDLDIYLVAPNGTIVEISTDNGGGNDNYTNTIITPTATQSITAGVAPFTGTYSPEGDLTTLTGLNANGTWILRICDDTATDFGTLNSWSLSFVSMATTMPDSVNLQSPYSASINQTSYVYVYGQIYKAGLTDATSVQTSGIQAWVGYSNSNSNPNTWTNWIPATFNQKVAGKDEFKAALGANLAQGTYYYATRFKINGGYYYYGGTNNGFWDGITYNSGVLIVNAPVVPANDNCSGAIALTVNPDYSCGSVTPGSVMSATASLVDGNNCAGSEDDDVWFSFVATATTHRISLLNISGSFTALAYSLWTGSDCNNLSYVAGSCTSPNPTGLTIGQTYYLRVNTVTTDPFQTTVFNVCIGTLPSSPDYVTLQSPVSATIAPGGNVSVYGRILKTGVTNMVSGQSPGIQAWIGYSTTNTNPNSWSNWTLANFNQKVGNSDEYKADIGSTLAPGTYYYATRFQQTGGNYYYGGIDSGGNGNFWDGSTYQSGVLIISAPVAPVNDDCSGAVSLTVGNVFSDYPVTGYTFGTTDSTPITINCDGTPKQVNSSVYYSVIVPPSGAVTIETKAASSNSLTDTVMVVSVGSCSSLIGMACNDNFTSTSFSRLNMFGQTPGSTLFITVYKFGGIAPSLTNSQFQISAYTAVLGSDTFDTSKFSYYPNPVNHFLNLSYDKEISSVEIFNILGQKLFFNKLDAKEAKIDMSDLPRGIYLVNIKSGNQIKTIKVKKE